MLRRPAFAALIVAAASIAILTPAQYPAQDKEKGTDKAGRKVALLVGVNNANNDLRTLDYAEKDASDLGIVLENLGYKVVLLSREELRKKDPKHAGPSAALIREQLAALVKELKPADTVLVAVSGHGAHLKDTDKLYYCPTGTKLSDAKTLVGIDEVMAAFEGCEAGSKVLLVDACRIDPKDAGSKFPEMKSKTRPLLPKPPGGTVALFSCSTGEVAYESHKQKRSYLFHYVIEGLSGKAADRKGEVEWLDLAGYVRRELPEAVKTERELVQTPEVFGSTRGRLVLGKVHLSLLIRPLESPFTSEDVAKSRRDYVERGQPATVSGRSKMRLEYVPAGTFTMGGDETAASIVEEFPVENEETFANEFPPRKGEFVMGFYMGATEVTVGQFREFVKETGHKTDQERKVATENPTGAASDKDQTTWLAPGHENWSEDHPVTHVTYNDALAFCAWLTKKEGRKYRLPTQKEWEYACRAGTTTRFWCGNDPEGLAKIANVPDGTHTKKTKENREAGVIRIAQGQTADKKTKWANYSLYAGQRLIFEDKTNGTVTLPTLTKGDRAPGLAAGRVAIHNKTGSVLLVANGKKQFKLLVDEEQEIDYIPIRSSLAIEAEDGHAGLAPVGQFTANPFGLYDMHGNVWEWCADTMKNAAGQDVYVIRGGCFL